VCERERDRRRRRRRRREKEMGCVVLCCMRGRMAERSEEKGSTEERGAGFAWSGEREQDARGGLYCIFRQAKRATHLRQESAHKLPELDYSGRQHLRQPHFFSQRRLWRHEAGGQARVAPVELLEAVK
jgi:hypothetical protein